MAIVVRTKARRKKGGVPKGEQAVALRTVRLDTCKADNLKPPPYPGRWIYWCNESKVPETKRAPGLGIAAVRKRKGGVVLSYVLRYRTEGGVQRMMVLGPFSLGKAAARKRALREIGSVRSGGDPAEQRRLERTRQREHDLTVARVCAEFLKRGKRIKRGAVGQDFRPKTQAEFKRILKDGSEVVTTLGKIEAAVLTTKHVQGLLDKIEKRGARVMARHVLGTLRLAFEWAKRDGFISSTPEWPWPKGGSAPRDRVLSEAEILSFWEASKGEKKLGPAFRLSLLTGRRRGEVLKLRWSDVSKEADGWWWNLPKEFTKGGRAERVALSPQAMVEIEGLPKKGWAFPSPKVLANQGKKAQRDEPIANPQKAAERMWAKVEFDEGKPKPTLHDLRRTAGTYVASLHGASGRFMAGIILGHSRADVTGIYDRHTYDQEKRKALARWGGRVEEIVTGEAPAKVVKIRS